MNRWLMIASLSLAAACGNSEKESSSRLKDMVDTCILHGGGQRACEEKYGENSRTSSSLANAAERSAARRGTVGQCYAGVADAMDDALGTSPATWSSLGIGAAHAYQFADWANANPRTLASTFGLKRSWVSGAAAPVGSLFVYDPGQCGLSALSGHIEIKTGPRRACSDHCRVFSCSPTYVYVPIR